MVREDAWAVTGEIEAMRETGIIPAFGAAQAAHAPVTVVPRALAPVPLWAMPKRQKPRSLAASGVIFLLTVGVVLGVLQAATPIGQAQTAPQRVALLAAGMVIRPDDAPAGPWDTSSGGAADLGLGGGAGPGVVAPGSAGLPASPSSKTAKPPTTTKPPSTTKPPVSSGVSTRISPPPIQPWPPSSSFMAVPGKRAFAVSKPSDGYYWWAFGQCTWWAQNLRRDENLRGMGNARYWAAGARARGYRVGSVPAAGATAVFQPGVQGAGGLGHAGHVEKVYPGGWFLISEMNFYWNGGGWGRVDYRFVRAGPGVEFIY